MQINQKTDLRIKLSSIERSKHRRVVALTFAIKTHAATKRDKPREKPFGRFCSASRAFVEPMQAKLVDSMRSGHWICDFAP
jgi:hypothetical protein